VSDQGPPGADRPNLSGAASWSNLPAGDAYWQPTGPHRPQGEPPSSAQPEGRPDFDLPVSTGATQVFPVPYGVPSVLPRTVYSTQQLTAYPQIHPQTTPPRRSLRTPTVVAVAALTALLVGAAAGAGADLASRLLPTTASPAASGDPTRTSTPSATLAPAPPTANTVAIAERLLPSTVTIRVRAGDRGGTGSGFVIDAGRGYVMTNNHVVELGARDGDIEVEFNDGTAVPGKIVGRSPSYDIAVVQVDPSERLRAVEIGDSASTQVGQTVIAFGAPLGLGGTVTQGIISAKDRPVAVGSSSSDPDANVAYIDALQTDAPINPGNSGGPLVDAGGRVIGVNSAILTLGSERGSSGNIGLGFAIPINQAVEIGDELIENGVATYPVLGAEMADTRSTDGVRLRNVSSGGPAAKAGLKGDDVIVSIDGRPISGAVELIVAIRTHRPGETVRLGYTRDGRQSQARVTLGSKEG